MTIGGPPPSSGNIVPHQEAEEGQRRDDGGDGRRRVRRRGPSASLPSTALRSRRPIVGIEHEMQRGRRRVLQGGGHGRGGGRGGGDAAITPLRRRTQGTCHSRTPPHTRVDAIVVVPAPTSGGRGRGRGGGRRTTRSRRPPLPRSRVSDSVPGATPRAEAAPVPLPPPRVIVKLNEPLTDDEGSKFEGNHFDFLLSLPLAEQKGLDSIVTPPLSAPSLNPRQAKTTPFATMKKQYFFRPRIPSVDSPNFLGDPWDAIANHAPLVAATQEGLNKRAFSDAARQDSPSVPSSMDLASSVPKYSRPNASRLFTFNVIGVIIFINSIESYNNNSGGSSSSRFVLIFFSEK